MRPPKKAGSGRQGYYRATRRALLLAVLYALAGQAFLAAASYSGLVLDQSDRIACLLAVVYTIPVAIWFKGRYWYYPVFIPVLWVPLSVIAAVLIGLLLPIREQAGGGFLLLFVSILNAGAVAAGVALGMAARGILAAVRFIEKRRAMDGGYEGKKELRRGTE